MTQQDLKQIEQLLDKKFNEKLKGLATKDDLTTTEKRLNHKIQSSKEELIDYIGKVSTKIFSAVGAVTVSEKEFITLKKRVEDLEKPQRYE